MELLVDAMLHNVNLSIYTRIDLSLMPSMGSKSGAYILRWFLVPLQMGLASCKYFKCGFVRKAELVFKL